VCSVEIDCKKGAARLSGPDDPMGGQKRLGFIHMAGD